MTRLTSPSRPTRRDLLVWHLASSLHLCGIEPELVRSGSAIGLPVSIGLGAGCLPAVAPRRLPVGSAGLEMGDLEAAAVAAGSGLTIAESMKLGSAIWRLRMVWATAPGEPTDVATAEYRALADRISEPELRSWFERQPLAPR